MLTVAYQLAGMTEMMLKSSSRDINYLGICSCDDGVTKYEGAGFQRIGVRMPVVDKEIVELSRDIASKSRAGKKTYREMLMGMSWYQTMQFWANEFGEYESD